MTPAPPPRIALVGDRSAAVAAHARIPAALRGLASATDEPVEGYWIASAAVASEEDVAGFDGIWLIPGSPYASMEGALTAIRAARTRGIPFLGTCGGFQHALIEIARDVAGIADAAHAETDPDAPSPLIVPLACSLVGGEGRIAIEPGSRAAEAFGATSTFERYHCSYGLDPRYADALAAVGLRITGRDDAGEPRIAELEGHPFFVGTLFQPELSSSEQVVHPLIRAYVAAVRARARLAAAV